MSTVYSTAMRLYEQGDYVHALSSFRNALELGNERCAYGLALCMYFGNGMFVDKSSAKQLIDDYLPRIEAYAAAGDTEAQQVLGLYYSNGIFVPAERERALYWLGQAAGKGDERSARVLNELCRK